MQVLKYVVSKEKPLVLIFQVGKCLQCTVAKGFIHFRSNAEHYISHLIKSFWGTNSSSELKPLQTTKGIVNIWVLKMDKEIKCLICQDFKVNVGHETRWCPKNPCKKCGQNGHSKMECMVGFENLPLPNEILLKILNYLDKQSLRQCFQVEWW